MRKRGQASLFILLGLIVALLAVAGLWYSRPAVVPEGVEGVDLQRIVDASLESASRDALRSVALSGGPAGEFGSVDFDEGPVSVWFDDGLVYVPSREGFEAALAERVGTLLSDAFFGVAADLARQGVELRNDGLTVEVALRESEVIVRASGRLSARQGARVSRWSDSFVSVPSDLSVLLGVAGGFVSSQSGLVSGVSVNALVDSASAGGMSWVVERSAAGSDVFTLRDEALLKEEVDPARVPGVLRLAGRAGGSK